MSHVVEGSVRTTGSRIRIAVQLIETRSQSQLWAEQYEGDANNLLTLQRDIAEAIARQITTRLGITRANAAAEARRHSTIAEAYEHYLRGRYHWLRDTTDGLQKAMDHFRRASRSTLLMRSRTMGLPIPIRCWVATVCCP